MKLYFFLFLSVLNNCCFQSALSQVRRVPRNYGQILPAGFPSKLFGNKRNREKNRWQYPIRLSTPTFDMLYFNNNFGEQMPFWWR